MTKLLYIKASPRSEGSTSAAIAVAFLDSYRTKCVGLQVDYLDLAREILPEFNGDKIAAMTKVVSGQDHTQEQKRLWDEITGMATRFSSADVCLLAVPMWNFGIPYKLKQYIDVISQPRLLWGVGAEKGYYGLLKGKKAILALTSGIFSDGSIPGFGVDHHSIYLKAWLNLIGVIEITELRFQPTFLTVDSDGDFERAKEAARRAGCRLS
jgi:FMN-dependent NADH-azoreductase